MEAPASILAVAIGNSRTRLGLFDPEGLHRPESVANSTPSEIASAVRSRLDEDGGAMVVVATVNPALAEGLERDLGEVGGGVYRIGRDVPIPLLHDVQSPERVGQDRLLNALGAYSKSKQACLVIDAGTAVTADFVDGEGIFQGGAILPGLSMMLRSLHEGTAALPEVAFSPVGADRPFGKVTEEAMRLGVFAAVRGAVRELLDRYAEAYGGYPRVIATGGDAPVLFEAGDSVVEHIVPDLQLIGIHEACRRNAEGDDGP
ncbi:MAG: type III pantothenate kinase [Phycisphaerales bacterium]|nr:type III pantothenate kinase [Phycisphaerales bacterium]